MHISQLAIQNYKSLRSVRIAPQQLSVLVGANASGKTNFADCLHFISEVYRHGLDVAVARKGGYENIAFRKMRRSKGAISIELTVELSGGDLLGSRARRARSGVGRVQVQHAFALVARGYAISAEYEVTSEQVIISHAEGENWKQLAKIRRDKDGIVVGEYDVPTLAEREDLKNSRYGHLFDFEELRFLIDRKYPVSSSELFVVSVGRFVPILRAFSQAVGGLRVYQISPTKSREFGVPTPRPELDRFGENLPSVIDVMQKQHERDWAKVIGAMQNILPSLTSIEVDYTSSRTLGLFFREEGIGRPWSVAEVSDGTIQTLALLVAIYNPTSTALVIEEPENSVHPWIIRHVIDACRNADNTKQIVLTTHSPIVINAVRPEEVWVVWRAKGKSNMASLVDLDAEFLSLWQTGDIPTFDYLDSGALPAALPPSPNINLDDLSAADK
jgi:predicted ATPase